eukprot:2473093-Pyramimonas_sp.AAC.1
MAIAILAITTTNTTIATATTIHTGSSNRATRHRTCILVVRCSQRRSNGIKSIRFTSVNSRSASSNLVTTMAARARDRSSRRRSIRSRSRSR